MYIWLRVYFICFIEVLYLCVYAKWFWTQMGLNPWLWHLIFCYCVVGLRSTPSFSIYFSYLFYYVLGFESSWEYGLMVHDNPKIITQRTLNLQETIFFGWPDRVTEVICQMFKHKCLQTTLPLSYTRYVPTKVIQ